MDTTENAGVYALHHRASGKLYVGSTYDFKGRRQRWWGNINQRRQIPHRMTPYVGSRLDWDFIVLWSGQVQPNELVALEQEAIDRIFRLSPERLLNSATACRYDTETLAARGRAMSERSWAQETGVPRSTIRVRLRKGWTPEQAVGLDDPPVRDRGHEQRQAMMFAAKTVVYDGDTPLSKREAAERLGCAPQTLSERLRRRRIRHGGTMVQLSELMAVSERYRQKTA